MIIIPAIDIINGKVVRLEKGDFNKEKVYSDDPVEMARKWQSEGAQFLHIVDLDGAKEGKIKNFDIIARVIKGVNVPCEVGGGLRREKDADFFLKEGAKRVVFGTKAFEDPEYLKRLISKFKEKIAVSIDFKNMSGALYVQKTGWLEKTDFNPIKIAMQMEKIGVSTIIATDISKDGTLKGPNIETLKQVLNAVNISVIASGGVSSLEDIKKLKEIKNKNLEGVIIGKALYEGRIDLKEAIEIAK
jgi:phosphoribosylformimino-5-aminoimidazole carboxamide ribotide isomerase